MKNRIKEYDESDSFECGYDDGQIDFALGFPCLFPFDKVDTQGLYANGYATGYAMANEFEQERAS